MAGVRVGVIGCGGIFRNLHTPYLETTTLAKVVAIADQNEEAAKEQAERFGAEAYTDWREVVDRDDIDAIDLATHPRPHREIAVAAAESGKHIFVEKPMCRNVAEADAMIAAADKAGVLLQVAYMIRFNPNFQKLKEILDDGTLGKPLMIYCNQVGWFRPAHPWLFVKEESGGMLVEQAIHQLDEWVWLYGEVSSVYARTSHVPLGGTYPEPEKAVENNAVFIANFKNGATAMMIKSWAAEVGLRGEGLVCSKGSVTVSNDGIVWKTHDMDGPETFSAPVPDDDTYRNVPPKAREQRYWAYASKGASIEHWLRCVAGEETPTTDGRVGRAGIEIAEAVYRSAESGETVSLPL